MRFVVKRLGLFVVALFGLSLLVFVLLRMLPGDVAAVIAGTNAAPERIASLRTELGLDKSYVAQYGDWDCCMAILVCPPSEAKRCRHRLRLVLR